MWELQIKLQLGKLALRLPLSSGLADQHRKGMQIANVEIEDVLGLAALPMLHRDPFDRLIVSQALRGGYRLVTRDPLVTSYGVPTLW